MKNIAYHELNKTMYAKHSENCRVLYKSRLYILSLVSLMRKGKLVGMGVGGEERDMK